MYLALSPPLRADVSLILPKHGIHPGAAEFPPCFSHARRCPIASRSDRPHVEGREVRGGEEGTWTIFRRLERMPRGDTDPTLIATRSLPLIEAPRGYQMFGDKQDDC